MRRRIWWFALAAACLTAAASLLAGIRAGDSPPGWVAWEAVQITGDGTAAPEVLRLADRECQALCGDAVVWESGQDIQVQGAIWCDINHDGAGELLLLCWRQGRYGQSRPFWVEENEDSWSQHIFIYQWTGETMRPLWMASDLGMEVVTWSFDAERRLVLTDRTGRVTAWDWLSWGLTNIPLRGELSFAALGDNLIHRQLYDYAFRHWDGDFTALYQPLAEELSRYDVTAIQQEGLFVDEPSDYASYPRIGTPIQVGQALADMGFSVVSCAGNHALDFGSEAIDRTAAFFESRDILCPGIQSTAEEAYQPYQLLERNGIRCALLGFTASTNGHRLPEASPYVLHTLDDQAQVCRALETARQAADLVVVFVHWGTEYAAQPDEAQYRWAQIFADCGVDVVLGTHPHVLQPWAWVEGAAGHRTLVYYSLGNCISAQTDPDCQLGGLAWFTVALEDGVCRITQAGLKTVETREEDGRYWVAPVPD